MEGNDLRTTFTQLQFGYRRKNDDLIVESIDKLIEYLQTDKNHYPDKIRIAIDRAIMKFKELQSRILTDMVEDYDDEWKLCQRLIDTVTHGVFIPWLNESGQEDFGWISGGDS